MQSEIMMLERLNHPNIVRVHELYEDTSHIYVVAEMIEHGNLKQVHDKTIEYDNLTEQIVLKWIYQIL